MLKCDLIGIDLFYDVSENFYCNNLDFLCSGVVSSSTSISNADRGFEI